MAQVIVRLLGSPQIERNGTLISGIRRKGVAILAYLATMNEPQPRDTLATLLWPDYGQADARGNLRRALYNLKSTIGDEVLRTRDDTLTLAGEDCVWCDVRAFSLITEAHERDALDAAALQAALDLYRGDFLQGFSLEDSVDFDEWQLRQAELLRIGFVDGSAKLVADLKDRSAYGEAIAVARRSLAVLPSCEATHYALMELYAQSGNRAAALRQYEQCRKTLKMELAVEPDLRTEALYDRIRSGALSVSPSSETFAWRLQGKHRVLPGLPTTFVPREDDLQAIHERLANPFCRLLTLLGPGGIGKTYLAIRAATELADHEALFPDGVVWVDLAGIGTVDAVPSAVAEAVALRFHRDAPETKQLVSYLCGKDMLLVLDNFEHLIQATEQVGQILVGAPRCKMLVTSRTALQIRGEWLYTVGGMPYPDANGNVRPPQTSGLMDYGAIQLFSQAAARYQNRFVMEEHAEAIVTICRMVDGMPLALELAAVWLKTMRCEDIPNLLSDNVEMLTAHERYVDPRQASILAIFSGTWNTLTHAQQRALARLSVLRGHFDQTAARAVAEVADLDLEALIDHSFLRHIEAENAYSIHELLRQLAERQLQAEPELAYRTHHAHANFYADYLDAYRDSMLSTDQVAALDAVAVQMDNIRAAWRWAVQHQKWPLIDRMLGPLFDYYKIRSKFKEGMNAAAEALAALPAAETDQRMLIQLHNRAAHCQYYAGELADSQVSAATAHALAAQVDAIAEEAYALRLLGMNAYRANDFEAADAYLNRALELHRRAGDEEGEAATWYALARRAMRESNFEVAVAYLQNSLAISRRLQRPDWIAYALDMLAFLNFNLRDYKLSIDYFEEALEIFQAIDDWRGVAKTIGGKERSWFFLGHGSVEAIEEAGRLSLQLFEAIGDRREMASRCRILCEAQLYIGGSIGAARAYIDKGLEISSQLPQSTEYRRCLGYSGVVAVAEGQYEQARRDFMLGLRLCQTAGDRMGEQEILAELAMLLAHGRGILPNDGHTEEERRLEAVRWLSMVRGKSPVYVWNHIHNWADEYLSRLATELPASAFAAAEAEGILLDPQSLVESLLVDWCSAQSDGPQSRSVRSCNWS